MSLIANLSTKEKVDLLKELYHDIAGKGQDGDTMLAHINPEEALLLKAYGGSGTINPYTGLPEYKKAIKKIATVAAIGAAAWFGGGALASQLAGGGLAGVSYAGATHLGAAGLSGVYGMGAATTGAGIFGSGLISKVGLGLQATSYLQQRKYASAQARATKQAAEEQMRINQMQERVRLVQERRQRLDIVRQQRIQQGTMVAGTAASGLGMQGTSGFLGATGAIQTQATANLEALNMASGASTAISRASQTAADYQSKANLASARQTQWEQVGSLGSTMYKKGPEIFDFTKSIFKTV